MTSTAGDEGQADRVLAAALAAWQAEPSPDTQAGVQRALLHARLLVPIVPLADGEGGRPEMAQPTLVGADGRPAAAAFSSLATMSGWRADARPVPVGAMDLLATALEAGHAVVIDVAGPVPFAIEGAVLRSLSEGFVPVTVSGVAADMAGGTVAGGLSAVAEPCATPPGLRAELADALAQEASVAEAYVLAPEQGPDASAVAVGLVLREELTPDTLVGLVRRLAEALGVSAAVAEGLDIAVLTTEQREAALAIGPPAYVVADRS